MYRILVVDDEHIIADSLHGFLSRLSNDEIEPFKAYSGREAISILETTKIDIVIADIRMPQMDGFKLAECIQSNWPECKIIFLTGHETFENAYKAIQLKDVRYVLKADGYEKLSTTLSETLEELIEEREAARQVENVEQQLADSRSSMQREYLRNIAAGFVTPSQKRFDYLQLSFVSSRQVLPLVGRLDEVANPYEVDTIERINIILNSLLQPYDAHAGICDLGRQAFWLLQSRHEETKHRSSRLSLQATALLPDVQKACKRAFDKCISFAISTKALDWATVPMKFKTLSSILDCYGAHDTELLLTELSWSSEISPEQRRGIELPAFEASIQNLRLGLTCGNRNIVFENLQQLAGFVPPETEMSDLRATQLFMNICASIISHLCVIRYLDSIVDASVLLPITTPNMHGNWGAAFECITTICEKVLATQDEQYEAKSLRLVQHIKLYVHENLSGDLSLTRLAEAVRLNPSYLSRYFKNATGKTIGEYIREKRIEKAKDLLRTSELTIQEVADHVGFSSAKYFAGVFKQATGYHPREWKTGPRE